MHLIPRGSSCFFIQTCPSLHSAFGPSLRSPAPPPPVAAGLVDASGGQQRRLYITASSKVRISCLIAFPCLPPHAVASIPCPSFSGPCRTCSRRADWRICACELKGRNRHTEHATSTSMEESWTPCTLMQSAPCHLFAPLLEPHICPPLPCPTAPAPQS